MRREYFNKFLKMVFISIVTSCFFVACLDVNYNIKVNEDGSGSATLDLSISKGLIFNQKQLRDIKRGIEKDGWNITSESDVDNKYSIHSVKSFHQISQMNDETFIFTFSEEKSSVLSKNYYFNIEIIKDLKYGQLYSILIKVELPGKVEETNGSKIASNTVQWQNINLIKGTNLYAKTSKLIFPTEVIIIVVASFILLTILLIFSKQKSKAKLIRDNKPVMESIYCIKCGVQNSVSAKFCINCGETLET